MVDHIDGNRIISVIVLYWPDKATMNFIGELAKKGLHIVAVVNGILPPLRARLHSLGILQIIDNEHNVGLSCALNQGCEFAFEHGASHVFLLDQDSRPEASLPFELLTDWLTTENTGTLVGVIAPVLIDVKSNIGEVGLGSINREPIVSKADTLATSGSLISKAAFQLVGGMYDWLFIDGIDHEWCFRARQQKLAILRSNNRTMLHDMGDDGITLFGRYRPLHRSPVRHRYIVRNTVFLARQHYVDLRWRVSEIIKTIYRIPVYILVSTDRKSSIRMMASGLADGMRHKRVPEIV